MKGAEQLLEKLVSRFEAIAGHRVWKNASRAIGATKQRYSVRSSGADYLRWQSKRYG